MARLARVVRSLPRYITRLGNHRRQILFGDDEDYGQGPQSPHLCCIASRSAARNSSIRAGSKGSLVKACLLPSWVISGLTSTLLLGRRRKRDRSDIAKSGDFWVVEESGTGPLLAIWACRELT